MNEVTTVRELIPKKLRKEPGERMLRPFDAMEEMLDNFFRRSWMEPGGWRRPLWGDFEGLEMRFPRVDLIDRDADLLVRAELPGVKKEELEISVTDENLHIAVHKEEVEKEKEESFCRCEMMHGDYERTILFPTPVDSQDAKAELKEGVLEILLPKTRTVRRHTVKVQ